MLKKLGLVTVGVSAVLVSAAPLASAHESQSHGDDDCNLSSEHGDYGVERCSTVGQGNGQGNALNGVELPVPDAPELPALPNLGEILGELPDLSNVPIQI
ncbi:hypothetical protein EV188_102755 [Actinomycetospora succinea]|uniref:Secreted protein n=1 Tax=Actinomycetospora succinea TaxID=663603 RepID=A0A4R6VIA2_9PSEU|nr:hypothetical protein [Actinomycetospora succinea]TDQ63098.1 hypothetical protein EV188_102755 [Actinomycetospora succinea]